MSESATNSFSPGPLDRAPEIVRVREKKRSWEQPRHAENSVKTACEAC